MKKIIISVLSAALVFASCQKEAALVENGTKTVSFTATTPETRTSFAPKDGDSYPVLWTGDEKVSVSYNYAAGKNSAVNPSADGKTATFAVEIKQSADATAHNFYAVSPASAMISASTQYSSLTIDVPSTQTPIDGSCDEAAQVIVAKHESDSFDEKVNFAFKHVTAYGNLSITLPAGVSEISSITLTAEKGISGRIYYYPANATFDDSRASSSITLLTSKTSEVFFACLPADLSNTSLKVVISANGTTYTKNVTLSSNFKFAAGRVSKFSVDMSGVKADEKVVYNLVTDPTTLKVGDKVIIAATYKDVVYALGTTGTTYRNAASVTVSGNSIVNPSDAVQVLSLEKGLNDNTCAFKAGSNYLCASTEDKNYLETQGTLDAYGSFRVSYVDRITTIQSKGKSTRNLVKYNYNDGYPRFSCYTTGHVDVVIYSDGKGKGAQLFSTAVDETPITPETPTFSSLAELVSKLEPTTDGTPVNVTLTNEKIVDIYTTGNYRNGIFLEVGDEQIEIYCRDVPAKWEVGGTVSATLKKCKWALYGSTKELCPSNWSDFTYTAPAGDGDISGKSFVKVTSTPTDWSGEYLIVYEDGNVAFDGSLTTLDVVSNTVSVTISGGRIAYSDDLLKSTFTIDGTCIKSKSGNYIGQTSDANGLKSSTSTSYVHSNISIDTSTSEFTAISGGAYLRYNATSNQDRFRYYKSSSYTSQKAIHLYKLVE